MSAIVYYYITTLLLLVYEPCASDDAGTEQHVDNRVGDAVEVREALNEDRHVVLALSVVVFKKKINVEQIVDEVRTPAKYERCNNTRLVNETRT